MDKRLLGLYADDLLAAIDWSVKRVDSTTTYPARPERYKSVLTTLIRLWHVLTDQADVLYWKQDEINR